MASYPVTNLAGPASPVAHFPGDSNLYAFLGGQLTYQGDADQVMFVFWVVQNNNIIYEATTYYLPLPLAYDPTLVPLPDAFSVNLRPMPMLNGGQSPFPDLPQITATGQIVAGPADVWLFLASHRLPTPTPPDFAPQNIPNGPFPMNVTSNWIHLFIIPNVYNFVLSSEQLSGVPTVSFK